MADSRRNALKQRLQTKLVEQDKKRESLYNQLTKIILTHLYDKFEHAKDLKRISDTEALSIIHDINRITLETIQVHKKNNGINIDMLITFPLENFRSILDPILILCREKCTDSKLLKYQLHVVTSQFFDILSKHICIKVPDSDKIIDVATAYAKVEYAYTLLLNTAMAYFKKNENIEQAKLYLKQYRKMDLFNANAEPDVTTRESMLQLINVNYYSGMALYSFHQGKHADVKNYMLKADAALTIARVGGYGFSDALDEVYKAIISAKLKEENFTEALRYMHLRSDCSQESIYQYQKVIKGHETGKHIRGERYMKQIKKLLEGELEKTPKIASDIGRLQSYIESLVQKSEEVEKVKEDVVATDPNKENNKNDPTEKILVEKKKKGKKEKKLQKALELKKERDLQRDVSAKKTKTIKFNENYIFSTDPKISNAFRLFGPKHQYVAIAPELIEQINQLDPGIRDRAMNWINNLCDVGKVLGNSQGMRGFILNIDQKYVKAKDASKPWRIWGEKNAKVLDDRGNQHTLWELKRFVQKHA